MTKIYLTGSQDTRNSLWALYRHFLVISLLAISVDFKYRKTAADKVNFSMSSFKNIRISEITMNAAALPKI